MELLELRSENAVSRNCCPDCGRPDSFVTDPENGEISCGICGLVIQEEIIDQRPEWRAITPEEKEKKVRVGAPIQQKKYDKGLHTKIDFWDKDAFGKSTSLETQQKMRRYNRWNLRAQTSLERNLSLAMFSLRNYADNLRQYPMGIKIPLDVEEDAARIYRKALRRNLVRGRSIDAVMAASLYLACRLAEVTLTLEEVYKVCTRSPKEIRRDVRILRRELGINPDIQDPRLYIPKISSRAKVRPRVQTLALDILNRAMTIKAHSGKDPKGVAAASLYLAAIKLGYPLTQAELSKAARITEVTVRNRYKGLERDLNKSYEPKFLENYLLFKHIDYSAV